MKLEFSEISIAVIMIVNPHDKPYQGCCDEMALRGNATSTLKFLCSQKKNIEVLIMTYDCYVSSGFLFIPKWMLR